MAETDVNGLLSLSDMAENIQGIDPFINIFESVMSIPDSNLTPTVVESIKGMMNGAITPMVRAQSVEQIVTRYKNENISRSEVKNELSTVKNALANLIDELNPSLEKRMIIESIFTTLYDIFDEAEAKYFSYDIILPITLEEGAKVPTYAHETDAAADLYAAETVVVPAHSLGNKINTGVRIGLPEGWVAYIVPRSSIGAKTPLRLSNSVGVIDSEYRGLLGVLYDNISDSDYTINAGDRIAQLIVMPCYHFQANVVDALTETERSSGGFGSTGK